MANKNNKNRKFDAKKENSRKPNPKENKQQGKDERKAGTSYASDNKRKYVGTSNDPAWYNKNKRLIADVSKVPFGYQLGKPIEIFSSLPGTKTLNNYVVPGIMTLEMINVPGVATTSSDGINLAATGLLQFVRKHLSTVSDAAAADMAVYILGIDDIYSDYANIVRLFGIANAYSAINMYYGRPLIKALYGFTNEEFDDFIRHINDKRSWFNNLIFKASTLYMPTDFTIIDRHSWLYSNYFTDAEELKAQLYAYKKRGSYVLDETTYDTGSALKFGFMPTTVDGLLEEFEKKIDAYRNSDSMMKIAADMRRAFDGRQQFSLAYVDENYMILPIYDRTVLSQIHNTSVIYGDPGHGIALKNMDITQDVDKNILLWHPYLEFDDDPEGDGGPNYYYNSPMMGSRIFNFYWTDVTEDDIIEGTRNAPVMKPDGNKLYIHQCGADICVNMNVYILDPNNARETTEVTFPTCINEGSATPSSIAALWSAISTFDWAPILYAFNSDLGIDAAPLGDICNYTTISAELLSRIHENVAMSMWSIPEFGGFDG